VLVDDITVSQALFPDLDEDVFGGREGTIYGLYQARYGITVTRISERISAAHAAARITNLLALSNGTPALVIKRVAYTYGDMPVEYRVSSVNSERHEYLSDLWRPSSARI
jgi:GntR family transcriptional regulator